MGVHGTGFGAQQCHGQVWDHRDRQEAPVPEPKPHLAEGASEALPESKLMVVAAQGYLHVEEPER